MGLMHAGLLLLLFCSAYCYQVRSEARFGPFIQDPDLEWARMETVVGEEMTPAPVAKAKSWRSASDSGSSTPEAKKYPEYVYVSSSKYQKEAFKPEKGARPLPTWVKEMLLGPSTGSITAKAAGRAVRPNVVEILCHVDRMYVRIRREVFKTRDAYKNLKLGTCPVNQGTKVHYYFLYLLKSECGFSRENNVDALTISNTLRYNPTGPVVREVPFNIPLQCKYPRFFHSYKVGFHPKLQGGTVFKALQPKSSATLSAQDASGNEITGSKSYTLGQPMYFEAKRPKQMKSDSADERLYINKCFMTAYQDPNSSPKYTVIDNQGCMIDGIVSDQSKFLTGSSKMAQKFSVAAFIFKDMASPSSPSQQLYMHCEISMGKLTPTSRSKACNYDPVAKKWKELYGDDSVCSCCESTCPSAQPRATSNIISSHSWKVDLSSKDGYVDVQPQMKSFDADLFSLEDPDMAEHRDFLNYWEHDY